MYCTVLYCTLLYCNGLFYTVHYTVYITKCIVYIHTSTTHTLYGNLNVVNRIVCSALSAEMYIYLNTLNCSLKAVN